MSAPTAFRSTLLSSLKIGLSVLASWVISLVMIELARLHAPTAPGETVRAAVRTGTPAAPALGTATPSALPVAGQALAGTP